MSNAGGAPINMGLVNQQMDLTLHGLEQLKIIQLS